MSNYACSSDVDEQNNGRGDRFYRRDRHGALFNYTGLDRSDGLQIVLPIQDWILNKIYTYQLVNHSSAETSEAVVSFSATQRQLGFGSAQASGIGAIEVGVQNNIRALGLGGAASRYNLKIKNKSEQALAFDFLFSIQRGFLQIDGTRSDFTAHARLDAMIDYGLLSPAGEFGGTYDETTGQLFRYFADVDFDGTLTHTSNADVILLERTESVLSYLINPYDGRVTLPIIPAFGELTVYYDMYALLTTVRAEVGGRAMLGDPTDLEGGAGISLVEASPVPEPASMLLMGVGLIGFGAWRRRRRRIQFHNERLQAWMMQSVCLWVETLTKEWIDDSYTSVREISSVSRSDRQTVDESRSGDKAILDWHRFPGSTKTREQIRPS